MSTRLIHWLERYLPAECASLVAANALWAVTDNLAAVAFAAAWSENVAYYEIMLLREVLATRSLPRAVRDLVLEFGLAEALDSSVIRPACIYAATRATADLSVGVFIGKLAADVAVYIPTIFAYELRRYFVPARRATTGANASMTRSKIIT
jgi:hypothetical protein